MLINCSQVRVKATVVGRVHELGLRLVLPPRPVPLPPIWPFLAPLPPSPPSASYAEIYNEEITDLLCPGGGGLAIRDGDAHRGVFVENLTEHVAVNGTDAGVALGGVCEGGEGESAVQCGVAGRQAGRRAESV